MLYANLLTGGKLNSYLADIDRQEQDMFERLVKQMAEREGVTEQFESIDQMDCIRNRAIEIVNSEIVCI